MPKTAHTRAASDSGFSQTVLLRELLKYDSMGIPLFMDGRRRSPRSIARACTLAEGGGYMRDYKSDKEGKIERVDFDYIETREEK